MHVVFKKFCDAYFNTKMHICNKTYAQHMMVIICQSDVNPLFEEYNFLCIFYCSKKWL